MHPFLLFPSLLFLAPLGATILRVTAALAFAYIARVHIQRREEIAETHYVLLGKPDAWLISVVIILESLLALALFFGFYTQLAAIAGLVLCTKHFTYAKMYPRAIPLCRLDYVFLFAICLSLLFTGAGAFSFTFFGNTVHTAMDLPL